MLMQCSRIHLARDSLRLDELFHADVQFIYFRAKPNYLLGLFIANSNICSHDFIEDKGIMQL